MGDINIDLSTNTTLTSDYIHLLHSNAFCNLITKPTRVTSTTQTIIDHILTNDNESMMIPSVLSYKISDHYPIYCAIKNINNNKSTSAFNKYSFRSTKNIDGNNFRDDVETALAPLLFNLMSTSVSQETLDEHFNEVLSAISYVIDEHAPVQTATRKQKKLQKKTWLTKGLLISIKTKQSLYKSYFLNGNDFEKNHYKKYANKLTRVKTLSKKIYYNDNITSKKNHPKEIWKFINSVIPSKRSAKPPLTKLSHNDSFIEDPPAMAELFNNYFVKIGETIASFSAYKVSCDFRRYLKHSTLETTVSDAPQPAEIYNLINTLNPSKASEKDDISPFFIRLGAEVLAPFLSVYLGFCFELGFFSSTFKTAEVVPIFKSGNKRLVQNYRPISLLVKSIRKIDNISPSEIFDKT